MTIKPFISWCASIVQASDGTSGSSTRLCAVALTTAGIIFAFKHPENWQMATVLLSHGAAAFGLRDGGPFVPPSPPGAV